MTPRDPRLTDRQEQVLDLISAEPHLSNAQVGMRLGMGEGTVRAHLREAFLRLGAHSRLEAVTVWRRVTA